MQTLILSERVRRTFTDSRKILKYPGSGILKKDSSIIFWLTTGGLFTIKVPTFDLTESPPCLESYNNYKQELKSDYGFDMNMYFCPTWFVTPIISILTMNNIEDGLWTSFLKKRMKPPSENSLHFLSSFPECIYFYILFRNLSKEDELYNSIMDVNNWNDGKLAPTIQFNIVNRYSNSIPYFQYIIIKNNLFRESKMQEVILFYKRNRLITNTVTGYLNNLAILAKQGLYTAASNLKDKDWVGLFIGAFAAANTLAISGSATATITSLVMPWLTLSYLIESKITLTKIRKEESFRNMVKTRLSFANEAVERLRQLNNSRYGKDLESFSGPAVIERKFEDSDMENMIDETKKILKNASDSNLVPKLNDIYARFLGTENQRVNFNSNMSQKELSEKMEKAMELSQYYTNMNLRLQNEGFDSTISDVEANMNTFMNSDMRDVDSNYMDEYTYRLKNTPFEDKAKKIFSEVINTFDDKHRMDEMKINLATDRISSFDFLNLENFIKLGDKSREERTNIINDYEIQKRAITEEYYKTLNVIDFVSKSGISAHTFKTVYDRYNNLMNNPSQIKFDAKCINQYTTELYTDMLSSVMNNVKRLDGVNVNDKEHVLKYAKKWNYMYNKTQNYDANTARNIFRDEMLHEKDDNKFDAMLSIYYDKLYIEQFGIDYTDDIINSKMQRFINISSELNDDVKDLYLDNAINNDIQKSINKHEKNIHKIKKDILDPYNKSDKKKLNEKLEKIEKKLKIMKNLSTKTKEGKRDAIYKNEYDKIKNSFTEDLNDNIKYVDFYGDDRDFYMSMYPFENSRIVDKFINPHYANFIYSIFDNDRGLTKQQLINKFNGKNSHLDSLYKRDMDRNKLYDGFENKIMSSFSTIREKVSKIENKEYYKDTIVDINLDPIKALVEDGLHSVINAINSPIIKGVKNEFSTYIMNVEKKKENYNIINLLNEMGVSSTGEYLNPSWSLKTDTYSNLNWINPKLKLPDDYVTFRFKKGNLLKLGLKDLHNIFDKVYETFEGVYCKVIDIDSFKYDVHQMMYRIPSTGPQPLIVDLQSKLKLQNIKPGDEIFVDIVSQSMFVHMKDVLELQGAFSSYEKWKMKSVDDYKESVKNTQCMICEIRVGELYEKIEF